MSMQIPSFNIIIADAVKGIILALLYFEVTKANDTTFENIGLFTGFYVIIAICGTFVGIDKNMITNAFLSKAIFTLVDDRIRKKDPNENGKRD